MEYRKGMNEIQLISLTEVHTSKQASGSGPSPDPNPSLDSKVEGRNRPPALLGPGGLDAERGGGRVDGLETTIPADRTVLRLSVMITALTLSAHDITA